MTSRWPVYKLKEVARIVAGATPDTQRSEYYQGTIAWATPKDLSRLCGTYLDTTGKKITREGFESCSTQMLPTGSVLFSSRAPIGLVAIAECDLCTNQGFKSFICGDKVDPLYLYYYLRKITPTIQHLGRGATFKEVSAEIVGNITIPLPPLDEQKRIATLLQQTELLLAKRRQALALADEFLKSVFLDLFGDPQTNPKGWPLVELQTCYPQTKEGTKCGPFGSALKKEAYIDNGIPVWRLENIRNSRFDPRECLYISSDKFKELQSYAVENGDIIISRAGTVGKMCVVEYDGGPSIISTNIIRLRLDKHKLLPGHFVALMIYCKGRVGRLKTGPEGAYTHMNTGILNQLPIPLPPIREQERFAEITIKIDMMKARQHASEQELHNLFESLLARNFECTD